MTTSSRQMDNQPLDSRAGGPEHGLSIPLVLLHVLVVAGALTSLGSGARIALDHRDGLRAWGPGAALHAWLPQGEVFVWHLLSATLVVGLVLAWGLRSIMLRDANWRLAGRPLRRANVLLHWIGASMLAALALTGALGSVEGAGVSGGLQRDLHAGLAAAICVYVVLHVAAHVWSGGLRELLGGFWPRVRRGRAAWRGLGLLIPVAATAGLIWLLPWSGPLPVPAVPQAPVVDGDPDDPVWQRAAERRVQLHLGNDPRRPVTTVAVRALHVGSRFYLLARWSDPERSLTHLPLMKTADGWQVFADGFERDDERTWYEDKLAVMVARSPFAALASIHLGPQPLAVAPASRSGRGYHYTTGDEVLDIWHWKAVRTDHLSQADDQYFGPPLPCFVCAPRWFGGYANDPKLAGGYRDNWQFFRPTGVEPKRLPLAEHFVFDRQAVVARGGRERLSMRVVDGHPWSAERDRLPVDTLIPSILTSDPFQGDRGHVGARGRWQAGEWVVEFSRSLDTGSRYDVPLKEGVHLWLAVFDHTQSRHAYHLRPLRLAFEP